MTVIIKELIIKTAVVENINRNPDFNSTKLKNEIVKDCLNKLKKTATQKTQR